MLTRLFGTVIAPCIRRARANRAKWLISLVSSRHLQFPCRRARVAPPKNAAGNSLVGSLSVAVQGSQQSASVPEWQPSAAVLDAWTRVSAKVYAKAMSEHAFRLCLRNWTRHRRWFAADEGGKWIKGRWVPWTYPTPFFLGRRRW